MTPISMRAFTLVAATCTMGFSAGTFALYQHTIMPGLHRTDDLTFVTAYQQIDCAIVNPWFMVSAFLGALIFYVAAAIAHRGTSAMPWILGAVALYTVTLIVTFAVNAPLNDALKAAGKPGRINVAEVRANFHESRWIAATLVRVATSTVAFGLLAWALVLFGRFTS